VPNLSRHDIVNTRILMVMRHGEDPRALQAINDFAGMLLEFMRAHHLKNSEYNERTASKIEKDLDDLSNPKE
jgi:hypothetical protein